MLTTTVSGPNSGPSCGASVVKPCALTPRKTTSAWPMAFRSPTAFRLHLEVAVGAHHSQAALLHGAQVGPARKEHHIGADFREPRADVAADGAGAGDDDSHDGFCL